jgi:sortase A
VRQNGAMRRGAPTLLLGALALLVGACGDETDSSAEAATIAPASIAPPAAVAETLPETDDTLPVETDAATTTRPTSAPTTSAPATTARPSTTVGLTTVVTLADTTLPVPADPPPPRAEEPYVELGTIEIPKIGITKKLLEGITLNTLDLAPGHWPGTAMPGQVGNVVIAGHRTSHDKPFRYVDQLTIGDEVIFTTTEGRFVYSVTGTTVVQPDAMYIIDQTSTPTATLFACHPPGSTRQRIVVTLALVP